MMEQIRRAIFYPVDLPLEKLTSWVRRHLNVIDREAESGIRVEVTIVLPSEIYQRLSESESNRLMNKELDRHRSIFRILVQEGD